MKIGIIVAMTKELNLLLPHVEDCSESDINGSKIFFGNIGWHKVAVMQCGIGKVNAAVGALTLIETFNPDLVINTGVAGGTGSQAKILDVVVADRVAYHDVWCGPCADRGQIQGMPQFFTAPGYIIKSDYFADEPRVKCGLIASGDQFVDNAADLAKIKSLYPDVLAVDMESAAIAHVCHLKGVDFISLRVISDTPGEVNNTEQYQNFWEDAPQQTFGVLTRLLLHIN
jgi:adenosylhomocysteine nucleosidase